ncbi:MAG: hypothetical protein AABX70_08475 [Nanoarchaeota archaeon]
MVFTSGSFTLQGAQFVLDAVKFFFEIVFLSFKASSGKNAFRGDVKDGYLV